MEATRALPYSWELEQLFKLQQRQPELMTIAVHHLIQENADIQWSVIVGAYHDEQINLGKAAELLGLSEVDLRQRFIELGIPLRIGPVDLAEAKAEIAAVRAWFADTTSAK